MASPNNRRPVVFGTMGAAETDNNKAVKYVCVETTTNFSSTSTGSKWFVTFVDDHTKLTWVFLMKEKLKVPHIFETFHMLIQTQFQTKIRVLRSDNGKKYLNSDLNAYLAQEGKKEDMKQYKLSSEKEIAWLKGEIRSHAPPQW
ncbi:Retrovirus-related Pol polyprotein from transposon TNT 1-94 [Senna tora]|uniref:Retrovirus-related Pol polyprotein from transposon TNT 1-94 n=1 Tax=Senna tora TaxID=362788 RepID=A0A834TGR0_9FABA|nr:Retrovirus-related Pol polyprotein from transposon TNT 1-94 [Senna tora]